MANGRVSLASFAKVVSVYGLRSASANPDRTELGTATGTGVPCSAGLEDMGNVYDNAVDSKSCVTSAPSAALPISTV